MESVGVTLLYPLTRHTWRFLFQDCYSPFFPFQPPTTQFLEGKLTFIMQFISLLLIQSVCLQGPYSIINVCSHFPFSRASILELWGQQLTLIMAFSSLHRGLSESQVAGSASGMGVHVLHLGHAQAHGRPPCPALSAAEPINKA